MPRYFTVLETESDRYSIVCQKVITVSLCLQDCVIYGKEVGEKKIAREGRETSERYVTLMIYVLKSKNNLTE